MKNYISGVILYDETIKQKTTSGKSIPELIKSFGSIPGIKVDAGAKVLSGSPEEKDIDDLWAQFHIVAPKKFPTLSTFLKSMETINYNPKTSWNSTT